MKLFAVVPIVLLAALGTLAAPHSAHAQWTKGMAEIENWPVDADGVDKLSVYLSPAIRNVRPIPQRAIR